MSAEIVKDERYFNSYVIINKNGKVIEDAE